MAEVNVRANESLFSIYCVTYRVPDPKKDTLLIIIWVLYGIFDDNSFFCTEQFRILYLQLMIYANSNQKTHCFAVTVSQTMPIN